MEEVSYRFKTVRQVLEYYMENRGFFAESWDDLAYMTRIMIEVMGRKSLRDLRPEHFIAYATGRRAGRFGKRKAKSNGTIIRELQHLKAAINFCVKARLVNPAHVPHIEMPEAPSPRDRWLNKGELEIMMKAAQDPATKARVRTFIYIVRFTAARCTAICQLKWDQVNFTTNMIEFAKHDKKKTKKRKTMVPMHPELRVYLEHLKKNAKTEHVLEITRNITAALAVVSKKVGIEGVTPHVFRHTWATHASMNGVSMTEIARVMGITVSNAERVYAKFQPDYLKGAIERAAL